MDRHQTFCVDLNNSMYRDELYDLALELGLNATSKHLKSELCKIIAEHILEIERILLSEFNNQSKLTSQMSDIFVKKYQLPILLWLKANGVFVSNDLIMDAIKKPDFKLLKFLKSNNLFKDDRFVAEKLLEFKRINLLKGLDLDNLVMDRNDISNDINNDSRDDIWVKYKDDLLNRLKNDYTVDQKELDLSLDSVLKEFISADPTSLKGKPGKYVEWVIQSYIGGGIELFEDLRTKVNPALKMWLHLKAIGVIKKSENPFDDYTTIMNICGVKYQGCDMIRQKKMRKLPGLDKVFEPFKNEIKSKNDKDFEKVSKDDYETILQTDNILVISPKTKKGSCKYGANTKWCTAGRDSEWFDYYNKLGDLYIILPKKVGSERFQVQLTTNRCRDSWDKPVKLSKIIDQHKDLLLIPIFKQYYLQAEAAKDNIFHGDCWNIDIDVKKLKNKLNDLYKLLSNDNNVKIIEEITDIQNKLLKYNIITQEVYEDSMQYISQFKK
jgi:hypothetical protein